VATTNTAGAPDAAISRSNAIAETAIDRGATTPSQINKSTLLLAAL
jgi:hypothetical protein